MFKYHPVYEERITVFRTTDLTPLRGVIGFDNAGEDIIFNTTLRLSEELVDLGATLSEATHRFQGSEAFRFEIRVPLTDAVLESGSIHGSIQLWDLDRDEELGEIPVVVAQIESLSTIYCDSPWVVDHGGYSLILGGEQLTHGRHPTFQAYRGFPRSAKLIRTTGQNSSGLPQLTALADYLEENSSPGTDAIVIEELKLRIHQTKSGPRSAYPYTGEELNTDFLGQAFKRGVQVALGVPRDLYATVPTFYTPQQIRHYQEILKRSFELVGIPVPSIRILAESIAAGIGTIQEILEEVDCHATRLILWNRQGVFRYVSVDIGATSTDFSLVSLQMEEQDSRIFARTRLEAAVGLPIGGLGFTRLIMLMLIARLAQQTPTGFNALPANLQEDLKRLAEGDIASFDDPFLVGNTPRTRDLLEVLTDVLPPHRPDHVRLSQATCEVLFDVAEELKVRLNTPLDSDQPESYPETVTLGDDWTDQWRFLCLENKVGDAQAAPVCSAKTMDVLFAGALKSLVDVVAGLCRTSETPVHALCLTGNGSLLRQLQVRQADKNLFLQLLPDDKFDRHPLRIFRAANPKLAVAKGAFAVFKAESEARDWVWQCGDILRLLPHEIGRINAAGKFEVLIKRGTQLPCECVPSHNPRELTLYKRTYEGEVPITLGTLSFTHGEGEIRPASIRVDEERAISNQYGEPITSTPDQNGSEQFRIPLLSELIEGNSAQGPLHW